MTSLFSYFKFQPPCSRIPIYPIQNKIHLTRIHCTRRFEDRIPLRLRRLLKISTTCAKRNKRIIVRLKSVQQYTCIEITASHVDSTYPLQPDNLSLA
jgi:hypothetical protein